MTKLTCSEIVEHFSTNCPNYRITHHEERNAVTLHPVEGDNKDFINWSIDIVILEQGVIELWRDMGNHAQFILNTGEAVELDVLTSLVDNLAESSEQTFRELRLVQLERANLSESLDSSE